MSAVRNFAKPQRIKASHRRRWKGAAGRFVQRYYDPVIGRFLSVDPVLADGNTGASFNRYWYANNNPYRFTDPDGRDPPAFVDHMARKGDFFRTAGEAMGAEAAYVVGAVTGDRALMNAAVDGMRTQVTGGDGKQAAIMLLTTTRGAPGEGGGLTDNAIVARGGTASGGNSAEGIAAGTATHPTGVTGFSAESANGASLCALCKNIPHGRVGVTTAGQIRAAGGDVIPTPGRSPNHVTVTGLLPQKASELLTPTVVNPEKTQ